MGKTQRILLFGLCLFLLGVTYLLTRSALTVIPGPVSTIIISSLIMISFVALFLEHFFTTPTDVLASTVAIILLLAPLRKQLSQMGLWYGLFLGYCALLFLTALGALLLADQSKSACSRQNRVAGHLKNLSVRFGAGRVLFFLLFIISMLAYVDTRSRAFLILFFYSVVIVLVDPKRFILTFLKSRKSGADVGEIFGVQSKSTFLAKLGKSRVPVRRFDVVEFVYSVDGGNRVRRGFVFDNYLLNEQQWIKVLACQQIEHFLRDIPAAESHEANIVYKLRTDRRPEFLSRFVGIVVDSTTIYKLRFEYADRVPLTEGSLLEIVAGGVNVLYQVVQGITETEQLESKNETGYIVGEAIQLGMWNAERRRFEKYGWVPNINTPVFLASDIEAPSLKEDEMSLGTIPNTRYPVVMNTSDAVSHHLGILGVTGSGKSVFARNLIREIIQRGFKVVCVDFTGEYRKKLADVKHVDSIISTEIQGKLFKAIDRLEQESAKFQNQQNGDVIRDQQQTLEKDFSEAITDFLDSQDRTLSLFELPDVANTTGILEYTKWFFRMLFQIAKKEGDSGKKVCIVLEEAHTVIPEWNFIGVAEKQAQSLVNNIGQIALQGRKYNVGFVVIAQRTANVSKTVLTQCNSIVAFQQFDKTSSDFLSNYMGQEMVAALPSLKFRQAVAVGKAFATGIPIIFEVPEITEPTRATTDEEGGEEEHG